MLLFGNDSSKTDLVHWSTSGGVLKTYILIHTHGCPLPGVLYVQLSMSSSQHVKKRSYTMTS